MICHYVPHIATCFAGLEASLNLLHPNCKSRVPEEKKQIGVAISSLSSIQNKQYSEVRRGTCIMIFFFSEKSSFWNMDS